VKVDLGRRLNNQPNLDTFILPEKAKSFDAIKLNILVVGETGAGKSKLIHDFISDNEITKPEICHGLVKGTQQTETFSVSFQRDDKHYFLTFYDTKGCFDPKNKGNNLGDVIQELKNANQEIDLILIVIQNYRLTQFRVDMLNIIYNTYVNQFKIRCTIFFTFCDFWENASLVKFEESWKKLNIFPNYHDVTYYCVGSLASDLIRAKIKPDNTLAITYTNICIWQVINNHLQQKLPTLRLKQENCILFW